MKLRGITAAALAIALLGAAPLPTIYTAPAGSRPAGAPHASRPYDVILPNGRTASPVGKSIAVGKNALGVAMTPDGRYAVVSTGDERDGYTLVVANASTMAVTDVYRADGDSFSLGVQALKDPAAPSRTLVLAAGGPSNKIYFFEMDARGKLHQSSAPLAMPVASDPRFANDKHAFPGSIALSTNHRVAYVVNNLANTVTAIDLRKRAIMHSAPVGYFPWGAAVAGHRLYVTDPGLMLYGTLPRPVQYPQFANVPFAPNSASALTSIPLSANGDVSGRGGISSTRMDVAPDGVQNVGGAHPSAIAVSKDGRYAYVCMTNVDRVAIVSLLGIPRVVGGLQLRLFDKAPYGTQPDAIVRSPDGKRLYVALAGMNAVAVLDSTDPRKLHRLGLIPTGWYPSALAISPTGRYIYVANAKGNARSATLQRIDMHKLPLEKTTISALRYLRVPRRAAQNPIVPPLRSLQRSTVIKHVVFILQEDKTYDSVLGDLTDGQGHYYGVGDPSLVSFGASVTPNLHALAREFGLATNFYADAQYSGAGHQVAAGGIATAYTEKVIDPNEDPEDYPRSGYLFNALARSSLSYRDYGELLQVSGYAAQSASDPADDASPTSGLGGTYALNVPALGALSGHVDLNYPAWNLRIRDVRRAKEFIRDYTDLEQRNAVPDFTCIWLPNDRGGTGPGIPPLAEQVADGDRALGMIVDFLTHQPAWTSTAIFITPDDAQGGRDHVDEHRTYAIVVSPYAKRGYTGNAHLSTVSILKTEEELLGLAPLSLGDLLATDMSGFFTATPNLTPFSAIPVAAQTAAQPGPGSARRTR